MNLHVQPRNQAAVSVQEPVISVSGGSGNKTCSPASKREEPAHFVCAFL